MQHWIDDNLAREYGVEAAAVIVMIREWIDWNRIRGADSVGGHYWTACSVDGLSKTFSYLTREEITSTIEKLVKTGALLVIGSGKESDAEKKWYTVSDKTLDLFEDAGWWRCKLGTKQEVGQNG